MLLMFGEEGRLMFLKAGTRARCLGARALAEYVASRHTISTINIYDSESSFPSDISVFVSQYT